MIYICIKKFMQEILFNNIDISESEPIYVVISTRSPETILEDVYRNNFKGLFRTKTWWDVHKYIKQYEGTIIKYLVPMDLGYNSPYYDFSNPEFKYKFNSIDEVIENQEKYDNQSFIKYLYRIKEEMEGIK